MGILVLIVAILSLIFPGVAGQIPPKTINYLLGIVMFGMGLTMNLHDFKVIFTRPRDVTVGFFAQFLIMPTLAILLSWLFSLEKALILPFNPKYKLLVKSNKSGYLNLKSTAQIGNICRDLGGGRIKKEDKIDFQAGIYLIKKNGDYVKVGETIAVLYSSKKINDDIKKEFLDNITIISRKISMI